MLPASFTPQFLAQLELLKLESKRAFLGTRQGGHTSLRRGHGIEFSDYRRYELGDNPRYIDWGVYGRSDRLYVKQFREEQALSVLIMIDASSSMRVPAQDKKWSFAIEVALSLAYIALMQQDSVIVTALGEYMSPQYTGGRAFHSLSRSLSEVAPSGEHSFAAEMRRTAARSKFPGIGIVISDFLMPLEEIDEGFTALRARNLDVTAIQVLGPSDLTPMKERGVGLLVDSETGEERNVALDGALRSAYDLELERHVASVREYCTRSEIHYARAQSDRPVQDFLVSSLTETGVLV